MKFPENTVDYLTSGRISCPVFDEAWKKAEANQGNIISGFCKTGIVPFKANDVDYSKVLATSTPPATSNEKITSSGEKIGLYRMLQMIEGELPNDLHAQFEECNEYQYDIQDSTFKGILYSIFKKAKSMCSGIEQPEITEVDLENSGQSEAHLDHSTSEFSRPNAIDVSQSSVNGENLTDALPEPEAFCDENSQNREEARELSPEPSTSSGLGRSRKPGSFEPWEKSPFRHYLKISDTVIMTRKVSKDNNSSRPSAVSGKEFIALKKQEENKQMEEEKERRKKERKRTTKEKKRKQNEEYDEQDDITFVLQSDDDSQIWIKMLVWPVKAMKNGTVQMNGLAVRIAQDCSIRNAFLWMFQDWMTRKLKVLSFYAKCVRKSRRKSKCFSNVSNLVLLVRCIKLHTCNCLFRF